jgi:hypothetical protein
MFAATMPDVTPITTSNVPALSGDGAILLGNVTFLVRTATGWAKADPASVDIQSDIFDETFRMSDVCLQMSDVYLKMRQL